MPDEINSNTLESVLVNNETILGLAPAESQGVTIESAAYCISLLMMNAVSEQHAAAQIGNASVVSACAEILRAVSSAPEAAPST